MALNLEKPRQESKLGRPRSPRDIRRRRVAVGMRSQGGHPDVTKWVQNPDVGSYIDEVKLRESQKSQNIADTVSTFTINAKNFERAMSEVGKAIRRTTNEIQTFSLTNAEKATLKELSIKPSDTPFWTSLTDGDVGDSVEIVTTSSTLSVHE